MKKIACVVFEIKDEEEIDDFLKKINRICESEVEQRSDIIQTKCSNKNLEDILKKLGIDNKIRAYIILHNIIDYMEKNPDSIKYIVLKDLYAYVEKKTGFEASSVSRNIGFAIKKSIENCSKEGVYELLGIPDREKLTNKTFIKYLADIVI